MGNMPSGWREEIPTPTDLDAEAVIGQFICHTLQLDEVPEFYRQSLIDVVKWHLLEAGLNYHGTIVEYTDSTQLMMLKGAPTSEIVSPVQLRLPTCPEQLGVIQRAAAARNLTTETLAWRMMAGIDTRIMRVFRTAKGVKAQTIEFKYGQYATNEMTGEEEEVTFKKLVKFLGDKKELIFVGFVEYMTY
jgi:hypothetical protein